MKLLLATAAILLGVALGGCGRDHSSVPMDTKANNAGTDLDQFMQAHGTPDLVASGYEVKTMREIIYISFYEARRPTDATLSGQ